MISTFTYAQTLNYGIRAGVNISNLDFDPEPTFTNTHRNGFAFGGFLDYSFSESTSILTELQWSAEGAKDDDLRADYINLPIQLRFHFGDLSLGFGPQVGLKVWGKDDGFSTWAVSGILGGAYMITEELFVDARYSYGITNILDTDLTDAKAKNSNIQIGFGIKL
jgi:hypothetical protein